MSKRMPIHPEGNVEFEEDLELASVCHGDLFFVVFWVSSPTTYRCDLLWS